MNEHDKRAAGLLVLAVLGAIMVFIFEACGTPTKAGGAYAISFPGPDGTTCYAIYVDGKAVGGGCIR